MDRCDIVVVGGGIAGNALATALARDGADVVVLEATEEYVDRVRGESMQPWGVAEARELGVEQVLLAAGGKMTAAWNHYDADVPTEVSEANPLPAGMMLPGVDGSMNLRHPEACQALADAATSAAARMVRGVSDVTVTPGASPSVAYRTPSGEASLAAKLVVGADGRNSTVRKQAGITLQRQPETHMIAGLLLDVPDDMPRDRDFIATQDDLFMASFHQPNQQLRVYLCPPVSDRHRFSGHSGLADFTAAMPFPFLPFAEQLRASTPAGPLATYPADDTWTDEPYVDGVVLIGDAAGYNNPIIGQGLSLSLRDARMVRDVVRAGDLCPGAFAAYGAERNERMRRVRVGADFMAATFAEDCSDRAARRARFFEMQQHEPLMFGLLGAIFAGPENGPPEAFDGRLHAAIRGARVAAPTA